MVGGVVLAFVIGGLLWGIPHTILRTCSGLVQTECPPDEWVELNPAAGFLTAGAFVIALIVLVRVRRLLQS